MGAFQGSFGKVRTSPKHCKNNMIFMILGVPAPPKKERKWLQKRVAAATGHQERLGGLWGRFWSVFGLMLGSQIGPKTLPRASLNLMRCWVGFWVHFRRGPRQVGGARGRGFRGVTCGNVGGFHRTCFDALPRAALHGPLLSLNGSVAGSPVGLRPQYRPLSQGSLVDLA